MKYLIDGNILSEPAKQIPDAGVVEWLRQNDRGLAVDPAPEVTVSSPRDTLRGRWNSCIHNHLG